eukprot:scaffold18810_cov118-Isochrysis_galbana.AAC.8
MPCRFSLVAVWPRSWQMGSLTLPAPPGRYGSCEGQVRATQPGRFTQAASAMERGSVHCRPKGGGVIQPTDGSDGKPSHPMESKLTLTSTWT